MNTKPVTSKRIMIAGSPKATPRRAAFSLLELVVAVSVLIAVLLPVGHLTLQSSRAFSAVAKRSAAAARATAVVDRLVDELMNGRFPSIDPPMPAESSWVRVQKVEDVVDGTPVYGDPIQIGLVGLESSPSDGVDNDGDGLIDEGGIRIWIDHSPYGSSDSAPGSEDETTIIASNVAKDGLTFSRQDGMLLIDVTLAVVAETGQAEEQLTVQSAVLMRND